jgi:hypothetical protein
VLGWSNSYALGTINVGFDARKYRELLKVALEKRKKAEDIYEYVRSEYPEEGNRQIIISKADLFGQNSYAVDALTLNSRGIPGAGYFFYMSNSANSEKNLDSILNKYRNFLDNVRYRHESEIPKEPGFCFKDGFVANDEKESKGEDITVRFKLENNPDVIIKITSYVTFVAFPSLLERKKEARIEERFPG